MAHEHDWLAPSPFWSSTGYEQVEFYRPALFELRSDDFMEEFMAAAAKPSATQLEAQRLAPAAGKPSKLFQPAHGCFYLAAASLCCREPGFPDRQLRRADGERAAFVLRKLVGGKEYGWVPDGAAAAEPPKTLADLVEAAANEKAPSGWQPLNGRSRGLLKGEERLPVFPVPLADGRQLFCGYVPVSSSQTYNVQPSTLAVPDEDEPRVQELSSRFITPLWRPDPRDPPNSQVQNLPDDVALTTSVYLVLELWEYLETHLLEVAAAVEAGTAPAAAVLNDEKETEQRALLTFLHNQAYKDSLSLAEALQKVAANAEALNAPGGGNLVALGFSAYSLKVNPGLDNTALEALREAVKAALPAVGVPVAVPKLDISTQARYVLRFVYERPQCQPAQQVQVSLPSQPFVFAPFFDADAPGRPVRIPLPSDVSIAGLRKAGKNVSFMMSDAMRKKMAMLLGKEETFLSDNPETNPGTGLDFAFICSFSIQIIFIVAFMLLLIFVVVFNIIFWWLAFFKICLPVPKALLPD